MGNGDSPVSAPGFAPLLRGFGVDQLDRHAGAVFGLSRGLRITYLNPAWFTFARENDGAGIAAHWGLGAHVLEAISGPARLLYEREYRRCLDAGEAWQHDDECSTSERYRTFHMDVFPLRNARGLSRRDVEGLLVVNSPVVDRPHGASREPFPADESLYTDTDGQIVQCSSCRRARRVDGAEQWNWIPEWVADRPVNVTGGLCLPCYRVRFNGDGEIEE